MNNYNYIKGSEIKKALEQQYRIYLCGGDHIKQSLPCLLDEQLEIGISDYAEFTADKPHYHTRATEYNFVVKGSSKVLMIETGEEQLFEEGSIYVLDANTKYACKNAPGTMIYFIKCPGGNDKQVIATTDDIINWLSSWD